MYALNEKTDNENKNKTGVLKLAVVQNLKWQVNKNKIIYSQPLLKLNLITIYYGVDDRNEFSTCLHKSERVK